MSKTSQIPPDSVLWNEFISGNNDAFADIYNTHVQSLYKFGRHFTKNESLIMDAIQDLFVDLYKYRSNLQSVTNVKLYLFVSLKRKIIRLMGQEEKFMPLTDENFPFIYSVLSSEDVENDIKLKRLELLEKAMNELSNRQREAIYLRYVKGMEYEELSEVMQINYQSARNLIFRGVEKLREYCFNNPAFLLFYLLKLKTFKNNMSL